MRLVRILCGCLLAFGVAMQGFAGVQFMDGSCSMHHMNASQGAQVPGAADSGHHHEGHAGHTPDPAPVDAAAPDTDEAISCTCIAGCHAVSSALLVPALVPQAQRVVTLAPPWVAKQFCSATVFPHWRPPALV
jgi:hypothetical protein